VESIFDLIQRAKTVCSLPIITIFVIGSITKLPNAFAAKAALVVGSVGDAVWYFGIPEKPHYLHQYSGCFILACGVLFAATHLQSLRRCCGQEEPQPYMDQKGLSKFSTNQWHVMNPMIAMVVAFVLLLTVALQFGYITLFLIFISAWCIGLLLLICTPVLEKENEDSESEEF